MGLILFWLVMAAVVAIVAANKGRNPVGWFFYGLVIWPIGLVHALTLTKSREAEMAQAAEQGRRACPHCAEMIMAEAKICRFCGRDVEPAAATAEA